MASFFAELPGEGNPLNEANLLHALTTASSGRPQQVKAGTAQLQEWERRENYFTMLQNAFIQTNLPTEVRLLAVIQLKNGIEKYWRKSATNAIATNERDAIRSRVLQSGVVEIRDTIANQNAVVAAKIARHDFPAQWPDLIKDLIDLIHTTAHPARPTKELSRVLLITHNVIKELATVRLARPRASFFAAAPTLFKVLRQLYLFRTQEWQALLGNSYLTFSLDALNKMNDMERVLKIMRRLIISGYEYPHRDSEISEFWELSHAHTQLFLQMLHYPDINQAYISSAGQQLKQLAKLHVDMVRDHPTSFGLLPQSVQLVSTYWSSAVALRRRQLTSAEDISEELNTIYEAFNLRALLIIQGCFKLVHTPSQQFKYKNNEGKEEPAKAKEIIKTQVFQDVFLNEMCNELIDVFFVFTETDIEIFTTEPEEWEMREGSGGDVYERSVKPCAERVFLNLTIHYKELIIQPLLAKLATLCDLQNDNVRTKDAAYSALGVAAPILHKSLDFDTFFVSNLIPELQRRQPEHSILRRRICLVLAQWIGLDVSEANRPLVYQVFQHLLDKSIPENDQVVRITAGKQFGDILCAWEFDATQFMGYGSSILNELVDLIQEVELVETKLALLTTIGTLIEAMDSHIQAFADQIVSLLPKLWNENSQENLMKQSIVSILFKLVKSMGKDSGPIHTMMLPTIKSALEPGSETQLYLLDDSLDLWTAILKQSPTPTETSPISPDLPAMLPLLFPVYEMEVEYIKKGLKITTSYILLAPMHLLHDSIRSALIHALKGLLTVRKADIIDTVCDNIELLIRAAEAVGGTQALQLVIGDLLQSEFLYTIFDSMHANWEARQTSGPNRKERPKDWKNETSYFVVLSRILLGSPQLFFSAFQQWASARQMNAQEAMPRVIDEWFAHMDSVGLPTVGKLLCLALTKLLESGEKWLLERLQDFMGMWTSTYLDLRDEGENNRDSLVYTNPPVITDKDIPEDERKTAVMYSDPIHTLDIRQFVQYHLQNAIGQCGGPHRFQEEYLVNVDKSVVKSFGELGIM